MRSTPTTPFLELVSVFVENFHVYIVHAVATSHNWGKKHHHFYHPHRARQQQQRAHRTTAHCHTVVKPPSVPSRHEVIATIHIRPAEHNRHNPAVVLFPLPLWMIVAWRGSSRVFVHASTVRLLCVCACSQLQGARVGTWLFRSSSQIYLTFIFVCCRAYIPWPKPNLVRSLCERTNDNCFVIGIFVF